LADANSRKKERLHHYRSSTHVALLDYVTNWVAHRMCTTLTIYIVWRKTL